MTMIIFLTQLLYALHENMHGKYLIEKKKDGKNFTEIDTWQIDHS